MAKFVYNGVPYSSKKECLIQLGLTPKSVFEMVSKRGIDLKTYLDEYFDKDNLGSRKRGVIFDGKKYPSVKKAFEMEGLTEENYNRYMSVKKRKEAEGAFKTKEDETKFLHQILSGDLSGIRHIYGSHLYKGVKYGTIEEMVNSEGYTIDQYNTYKIHRKLDLSPEEVLKIMVKDTSFKGNKDTTIYYKDQPYESLYALVSSLGYEYTIFTSNMYSKGLTYQEFLDGIEEGKYEKPIRRRKLVQKKIGYNIANHEFTKQQEIADYLGISKATLISRANKAGLTVPALAEILIKAKDNEENAVTN